jgi:hypothetical protein
MDGPLATVSLLERTFNMRQYMRLLVLRGRIQDGLIGTDDLIVNGVAA